MKTDKKFDPNETEEELTSQFYKNLEKNLKSNLDPCPESNLSKDQLE